LRRKSVLRNIRFSIVPALLLSGRFDLPEGRDSFYALMITVTENAVRRLRSLLKEQLTTSAKGLRVQVVKGGCSGLQYEMLLDEKKVGDAIVEEGGVAFFVDPESASYLRDATVDFHDGLTGAGFRILNPNVARTCGCGTSFEASPGASIER
jgi:iron-sulfur cluster assembly accessory protein